MKTFIKILAVVFLLGSTATAKGQAFEQGNIVISGGYGFPNLGKAILNIYKSYDNYDVKGSGPFHAKVEYALSDNFGAGISFNLVNYQATFTEDGTNDLGEATTYNYTYKVVGWSALARMNFHFGSSDVLDPYVGLGAGYRSASHKFISNPVNPYWDEDLKTFFPFGFEMSAGMRYYIIPMVGIYAEIGLTKSLMQAGISIKI